MYAGRVVEEASVEKLFASPAHPYTKGLIRSIPRIDLVCAETGGLSPLAHIARLSAPAPSAEVVASFELIAKRANLDLQGNPDNP